ncbi:hypothetical protein [Microvirga sp. VF16]|uniref:hypothetical protein n=1 Tax=Microvirga sp. VF16 TaxID=2807101 RepID=UPI00193D4B35|nr:hypothetical protein [Microvirga sp. VF16]QRM34801.1 hypothetical protein JO965_41815 [Microvirga sp. VF16]
MTELPALSTLARKALDVLKEGGEFRYALETSRFTKREQFKTHLKTATQGTVRGIGFATMDELRREGIIVPVHHTSVSTYYRLRPSA